jgi:ABC-type multidrug transport system ATPase subunit
MSAAVGIRVEDAIEVRALTKRYGEQTALENVAFTARPGEVLGIIGPNGAGKTTLLEAIAGLTPIDCGEVCWLGRSLPLTRRRGAVFYLPDGVRPYQDQFAEWVVSFFASVYRRTSCEVAVMIAAIGLAPVLHKRVSALSKGYARRLMLALGLLAPHPVVLMDEPFDGFDLRQVREVMALLRKEAAAGRCLILAIHQLGDAELVCDRFALLADGRLRGVGTLDDLRSRVSLPSARLEDIFLALT